jgi:23S rRNA (cytidine1920-2'-O)/16S rRNA (cytidine1409-2'-O)-methyltransferase
VLRLDVELVNRGLAASRTKAQDLIKSNAVQVAGLKKVKSSTPVDSECIITVQDTPNGELHLSEYVARSAFKLLGFLDSGSVFADQVNAKIKGASCLDIGASTGGFTQVLLEKGAANVVCLDVGHGQLHPLIDDDPKVTNLEGVNIKDANQFISQSFDVIVCDVSFISLKFVIPELTSLLDTNGYAVLLVKPQFELGKQVVSRFRNAVITDQQLLDDACLDIEQFAIDSGFDVLELVPAGLTGSKGNQEFVMCLRICP